MYFPAADQGRSWQAQASECFLRMRRLSSDLNEAHLTALPKNEIARTQVLQHMISCLDQARNEAMVLEGTLADVRDNNDNPQEKCRAMRGLLSQFDTHLESAVSALQEWLAYLPKTAGIAGVQQHYQAQLEAGQWLSENSPELAKSWLPPEESWLRPAEMLAAEIGASAAEHSVGVSRKATRKKHSVAGKKKNKANQSEARQQAANEWRAKAAPWGSDYVARLHADAKRYEQVADGFVSKGREGLKWGSSPPGFSSIQKPLSLARNMLSRWNLELLSQQRDIEALLAEPEHASSDELQRLQASQAAVAEQVAALLRRRAGIDTDQHDLYSKYVQKSFVQKPNPARFEEARKLDLVQLKRAQELVPLGPVDARGNVRDQPRLIRTYEASIGEPPDRASQEFSRHP